MIIEESKDRYIRVLEYKHLRVCMLMEVSIYQKDKASLISRVSLRRSTMESK